MEKVPLKKATRDSWYTFLITINREKGEKIQHDQDLKMERNYNAVKFVYDANRDPKRFEKLTFGRNVYVTRNSKKANAALQLKMKNVATSDPGNLIHNY